MAKKVDKWPEGWSKRDPKYMEYSREYAKRWRASRTPEELARFDKVNNLARHHLPDDITEVLIETREGICNICDEYTTLVVEHDHDHCNSKWSCGSCTRGFTCMSCNSAIGYVKNNPRIARALAAYLDEYLLTTIGVI